MEPAISWKGQKWVYKYLHGIDRGFCADYADYADYWDLTMHTSSEGIIIERHRALLVVGGVGES